jgi:hypothetical protein
VAAEHKEKHKEEVILKSENSRNRAIHLPQVGTKPHYSGNVSAERLIKFIFNSKPGF